MSSLSKSILSLDKVAKQLKLGETKPKLEASPEEVKASRLSPARIRKMRTKLGISMRELGLLVGSSLGTVQMWEKGKFSPKPDKKAALIGLRKLGKREIRKMLAVMEGNHKESKKDAMAEKPARKSKPPRKARLVKSKAAQRGTRQAKVLRKPRRAMAKTRKAGRG